MDEQEQSQPVEQTAKPKKKAKHKCSTWNVALGKAKLVCPECGKSKE